MAEPVTTTGTAFSYALSQVPYALAAVFTGTVVMFCRKKQTVASHGKLASAAIIGGACAGGAVIFGGALAVYLGMNPNDVNTATAIGGGIGLVALGVVSGVANYLDKSENKDIFEMAHDVKAVATKPAAKPAAKKTVRRVRAGAQK